MSDRLTRLTAAMADALAEVAPASDAEWRKVRVVTVELEVGSDGAVTYARGWLEKRLSAKSLAKPSDHAPECEDEPQRLGYWHRRSLCRLFLAGNAGDQTC